MLAWLLATELPFERLAAQSLAIVGALALGLLGYASLVWRLDHVVRLFALRVAWPSLARIHAVTLFYYFFLPAGVGYDLVKVAKIAAAAGESNPRRLLGVASLERLTGGIGLAVLLLIALPFIQFSDGTRLSWLDAPAWLWGGLSAATVAGFLALAVAAHVRWPALWHLLPAIASSAVAYLLVASGVWLAGRALDIPLTLGEVLVTLSGTLLLQLVPVNLVGVSFGEVAAVALYMSYGLARPDAMILTVIAYLQRLVVALIGAGVESVHSAVWLHRNGGWRRRPEIED